MTRLIIKSIQLYRRYISPALGHHCRFAPTCSRYAEEAISKKGIFPGMTLAAYRILKCHPFHQGGFDPVE